MSIQTLGILGAGQMGTGIAQVAAQSGFQVLLADRTHELAEAGKKRITDQLKKLVEKNKLNEKDMIQTLHQIQPADGIKGLETAEFVIEAVTENPSLKFQIFKNLDEVCRPEIVLATNTSSISITAIAARTKRPHLVAGMHFMNPVPIMKLVEGIRGIQCTNETFTLVRAITEKMGKVFVEVKDMPGFAVNRILMPMINEAIFTLHEGIASVEDIDTAMKLGTHQPMGPLALADFIGLDTCLAIMEVMHEGLGESKYRPCPLLKQYVNAGWLGKKSGRGFYRYEVS